MTYAEKKALHAWWLLKIAFGIAIIVAGIDKFQFMHLVTSWEQYVSPKVIEIIGIEPTFLVLLAGIAEMIAGALILIKTKVGAYISFAWMLLVIANLLTMGMFYDIIVRDALIAISLYALILLSDAQEKLA